MLYLKQMRFSHCETNIHTETNLAHAVLSDGDSASVEKTDSDHSPDEDANKSSKGIDDHCIPIRTLANL